jgi:hypothetical protein
MFKTIFNKSTRAIQQGKEEKKTPSTSGTGMNGYPSIAMSKTRSLPHATNEN